MEIECLVEEMTNHLKDHKKGERLRNGVRVAIMGKPNVGKSSLLNILSKICAFSLSCRFLITFFRDLMLFLNCTIVM